MKPSPFLCLAAALTLTGCVQPPSGQPSDVADEESSSIVSSVSSESDLTERETKNVTYQGVVQASGISIYQQGTHRLMMPDGRFILLESTDVDLNGYVGEEVEVTGALRPTVEAGGMIMRVEQAHLLSTDTAETDDANAEESLGDDDESLPAEDEAAEDLPEDDESTEQQSSSSSSVTVDEEEDVDDVVSSASSVSSVTETSSSAPAISEALALRIESMASQNFAADQWTQQYCTAHIGFCIPVHRNWWFKSFGTTSSLLWHVELSSEEIQNLHDGPIAVNLVAGTVGSKKSTDGQVRVLNGVVTGFREWTENRHFEIVGAASLEEPVRYITQNLEEYVEE